jgi:hypothetical protein
VESQRFAPAIILLLAPLFVACGCAHHSPAHEQELTSESMGRLSGAKGDDVPQGGRRLPSSIMCDSPQPVEAHHEPVGLRGSLDKDDIRRIVRGHISEIRVCYEAQMGPPPYPRGRVSTRFAIAASGRVESSCIADSTVKNPRIDRCIVDAILKWEFPRPIGGRWVLVEYPFRLIPGDDNSDTPPKASD